MSLSIKELQKYVKASFCDVELVDDSIIRFTRKAGGRPFAVYYVDLNAELPNTPQSLAQYQDRVIGKHYFEGRKSLQWSNYLLFVNSSDQLTETSTHQAKKMIEDDRNYARKFVISENELYNSLLILSLSLVSLSAPLLSL